MKRFAIGDIHGCHKTLEYLVHEKIKPGKGDKLFFVGDYIDRGPDSKAVIDFLFSLREQGIDLHLLRGNHEEMLLDAAKAVPEFNQWIMNDGFTTLRNFGIDDYLLLGPEAIKKIPHPYLDFFSSLNYYDDSEKDYVFVHAGLNFDGRTPYDDKKALVWQREEDYNEKFMQGRILVHGHTPVPVEKIQKQIEDPENKIINLDAGCVYKSRNRLGRLAALNMDSMKLLYVANRE